MATCKNLALSNIGALTKSTTSTRRCELIKLICLKSALMYTNYKCNVLLPLLKYTTVIVF